jgi:predicted extracellular nuclease
LPPPSTLGAPIPWQIDNDELEAFEPWNDAVDYYESLEGMRVQVPSAVVVGSPSRFGDFTVLANNGGDLGPRTSAGGILLTAESGNSQRLQIDPRLVQSEDELFPGTGLDSLTVGSTFTGSLVGVLDYSFGAFEVVLTEPAAQAAVATLPADQTSLRGSSRELTVATFNVENLDALDSPAKYSKVAATIVEGLGAPDLLALQEVQDENGTIDDGTVSAAGTLGRLVDEIVSVGGPLYEYHQIDPENNADGGSPGANIRVAFLVNPQRLSVPLRGSPGAQTPTRIEILDGRVHLFPNPGRIAARDRAFSFDETLGYEASRKALALEVEFAGKRLFVVNLHLKSKRGDESLFGPVQPPGRRTEEQRLEQARSIRTFVEKLQKVEREAAIIVLGDLNDHEFRPPVRELEGEILANLVDEVPLTERYTYNFRGNSQVLDHILVSASIAEKASPEIDIVHVNADFPAAQRASDHDPVVIRLDLGNL